MDLTDETHGNFHGLGLADVCTRRVFDKIDYNETYPNPLTSRLPEASKIPLVIQNDFLAIKAAIQTCCNVDYSKMRIVRIKNTQKLDEILISEHLLDQARLVRRELLQIGKHKPLTDPEVVKLSQTLDILLNKYYRVAM